MDPGLRLLLLSGLALLALASPPRAAAQETAGAKPATPQVVEPQVKRREVKTVLNSQPSDGIMASWK